MRKFAYASLLLALFVVGLGFFAQHIFWGTHPHRPPPAERRQDPASAPERIQYAVLPEDLGSIGEERTDLVQRRYLGLGRKLSDKKLEKLRNGRWPCQRLFDRETMTYIQGDLDLKLDIPKAEFRFRKKTPTGASVPCPVTAVAFKPIRDGRRQDIREREIGGCQFNFMRSVDWVHAARFMLSDSPDSGEYYSLAFGQKYYVRMYRPTGSASPVTRENYGTAVITIPTNVTPGNIAVFELDPTKRTKEFSEVYRLGGTTAVNIEIRDPLPNQPAHVLFSDPGTESDCEYATLNTEGIGKFSVHQLGGELVVTVGGEMDGYFVYYKGKVDNSEIVFPRDADIVVKPDDVISFRVQLPRQELPEDCWGIILMIRPDSSVQVAGIEFDNVEEGQQAHDSLPDSVPLNAAPGTYFVSAGGPDVLGRITVTKDDAGKTILIQPVNDR